VAVAQLRSQAAQPARQAVALRLYHGTTMLGCITMEYYYGRTYVHSAPAGPPGPLSHILVQLYIDRSWIPSAVLLLLLIDPRRCMGGRRDPCCRTAAACRILWTPAGVHTSYVAQPMGRLAVRMTMSYDVCGRAGHGKSVQPGFWSGKGGAGVAGAYDEEYASVAGGGRAGRAAAARSRGVRRHQNI
jgi:hypothetical protein